MAKRKNKHPNTGKTYFSDNNPIEKRKAERKPPRPRVKKVLSESSEEKKQAPVESVEAKSGQFMQETLGRRSRLFTSFALGAKLMLGSPDTASAEPKTKKTRPRDYEPGYDRRKGLIEQSTAGPKEATERLSDKEINRASIVWQSIHRHLTKFSFVHRAIPRKKQYVVNILQKVLDHYNDLSYTKSGDNIVIKKRNISKLDNATLPDNIEVHIRERDGVIMKVMDEKGSPIVIKTNKIAEDSEEWGIFEQNLKRVNRRFDTDSNGRRTKSLRWPGDRRTFTDAHCELPRQLLGLLARRQRLFRGHFGRNNETRAYNILNGRLNSTSLPHPENYQQFNSRQRNMRFLVSHGQNTPHGMVEIVEPGTYTTIFGIKYDGTIMRYRRDTRKWVPASRSFKQMYKRKHPKRGRRRR